MITHRPQSTRERQTESHPCPACSGLRWAPLPRPPKASKSQAGRVGAGESEEAGQGLAAPGTSFYKDRGGTSCSTEEIFPKVRVVVLYFKWPLFITVLLGSLSWQMMIKDSSEGGAGLSLAGPAAVRGGSTRAGTDTVAHGHSDTNTQTHQYTCTQTQTQTPSTR